MGNGEKYGLNDIVKREQEKLSSIQYSEERSLTNTGTRNSTIEMRFKKSGV